LPLPASIARADILVIAVPDDAIAAVAAKLSAAPVLPRLVVHLSGRQGAAALSSLLERVEVGSFHPLASLDGKSAIPRGTLIAVDASSPAQVRALEKIARAMKCTPARIAEKDRIAYHAGAVVAGNLPVALLSKGIDLLVSAGVPEKLARESLARLLVSAAENAVKSPLSRALTGPIARGDINTVRQHLTLIDDVDVDLAALYRALSRILIDDVVSLSGKQKRGLAGVVRAST